MTAEELSHYSAALDEIYRLRGLLAYEAVALDGHLKLASFPRSRRAQAEDQVKRMVDAAQGRSLAAYNSIWYVEMNVVRKYFGIETLTRGQFEKEGATMIRDRADL